MVKEITETSGSKIKSKGTKPYNTQIQLTGNSIGGAENKNILFENEAAENLISDGSIESRRSKMREKYPRYRYSGSKDSVKFSR
mmetsp:Transcript_35487/g.54286  ORF Transcript_35487/g.54286 Transcript_35487/m.54286 type:complete len:84 (-) Transcript_35487:3876-4127(-)